METFNLKPKRLPHKKLQRSDAPRKPRPNPLLLALSMQNLLESGVVNTRAELAGRMGVSRARITQIMNLLRLPAEIREEILRLPEEEHHWFTERKLRGILRLRPASSQVVAFGRLRAGA